MKKWSTPDQLTRLLADLIRIPSITGSPSEKEFPLLLAQRIRELDYFQASPDLVQTHHLDDGNSVLTALVRSSKATESTVVLLSHFDVVDVEDYGELDGQAFEMTALTEHFRANPGLLPEDAREDLVKGDWVFGRGVMDMKCGLVLHLSLLERASLDEFEGNILLLAVPDEEVNSSGMRAAVSILAHLAQLYGLNYKLFLNSEPMLFQNAQDPNRYIYTGTIGKVLPGFLCFGKETHVGESMAGLNANYMASQITCEIELNTTFCEKVDSEATSPPTNLIQRGLKKEYSVQTPFRAVTLFNLLTMNKTADEVKEPLLTAARQAARRMEEAYAQKAEYALSHGGMAMKDLKIRTLTYDELYDYACRTKGTERVEQLMDRLVADRGTADDRDVAIMLTDELALLCKELTPMIVLFFAPPYYPAVCSSGNPFVEKVVEDLQAFAGAECDVELTTRHYMPGITDLSYTSAADVASLQSLASNMPNWGRGYSIPIEDLKRISAPVLNVGPVGKDAHKWTERLDRAYAFDKLALMLPEAVHAAFRRSFEAAGGASASAI
ncbi:M20/M25/M40 family metallo-hydrolase [Paenibacillus sp. P96]|uniref:M20/M25/M40 family metallo-hydrolase n=1 Tax=Paenibacillus zeirhizosphaerae TaxID=2987519 RepID=A0ABT9FKL1_9BACL|nr:M20/M25/M40 family metallo-hydrolase [Paenibacillus sp. P96]MDP4095264.1 M20/M25/M40 family metallo-hydrolase [Paenibacillus sp. P96]